MLAQKIAAAGLHSVSVSIDGLENTHDLTRAARGSFKSATEALEHLRAAGLTTAAKKYVMGIRGRLVPKVRAPGLPFDHGLFEVVSEPLDAPDPRPTAPQQLVKIRRAAQ